MFSIHKIKDIILKECHESFLNKESYVFYSLADRLTDRESQIRMGIINNKNQSAILKKTQRKSLFSINVSNSHTDIRTFGIT